MLVDAMLTPSDLRRTASGALAAREAGFGGVVITETSRSAYMASTAVALGTPGLRVATGVAVAFARSPMVTAGAAWELQQATDGRFRLGLGTQVRAHVERRYASEFDPPGPRMAEYIRAVRAAFAAFRGERLDFHGQWWSMNLLPAMWSPGPIEQADPPVDVAAVNPWMLRMAGELADGVHVHPLNHAHYLRSTVVAEVAEGAARVGRDPASVELMVPCFTVAGDDEAERSHWRELARMQVAFYGSTPNYSFIFEQLDAPETTPELRRHQKSGDLDGMAGVITDDLLSHFVVEASWDGLPAALVDRYGSIASKVVLYFADPALADERTMRRFGEVAREVERLTGPPG
jgi:probable F420-dependent oxidoreductase